MTSWKFKCWKNVNNCLIGRKLKINTPNPEGLVSVSLASNITSHAFQ